MSNGLALGVLKTVTPRGTLFGWPCTQFRCASGRKFLIPDSFQPHLKTNQERQKPQRNYDRGHRKSAAGNPSRQGGQDSQNHGVLQKLDNGIEQEVQFAARDEFGFSTESVLQEFCGQTHHPHIASSMKGYVSSGPMDLSAVKSFWNALLNVLPEDNLNKFSATAPRGSMFYQSYSWASGHLRKPNEGGIVTSTNHANLGWHLFLFTTPIIGRRLLFDGTDARFLPGPAAVWKHRLWAGGSINLHKMFGLQLRNDLAYHQVESPTDLRIVGVNRTPEKLFVTVRKRFYSVEGKMHAKDYDVSGLIRYLKRDPEYNESGSQVDGPLIEESYTLCFLRDPPNLAGKGNATKVISPPLQPKFSYTFTPDRHLLFCWSALSYNAHLVHLDQAFAQKEYGAKDLLVHGPLTVVLVLEWFHREITKYAMERQLSRFHLRSIDYKNLAPLYVDEPMTICTKPSKFQTPGTLADSWEVWVQKDLEGGLPSMVFKGTIKLGVETDPDKSPHDRRMRLQSPDDDVAGQPGTEVNDAGEFKSPFF